MLGPSADGVVVAAGGIFARMDNYHVQGVLEGPNLEHSVHSDRCLLLREVHFLHVEGEAVEANAEMLRGRNNLTPLAGLLIGLARIAMNQTISVQALKLEPFFKQGLCRGKYPGPHNLLLRRNSQHEVCEGFHPRLNGAADSTLHLLGQLSPEDLADQRLIKATELVENEADRLGDVLLLARSVHRRKRLQHLPNVSVLVLRQRHLRHLPL
mmetsp:Transcript_37870/g.68480  ORF Transcript_37870/g.68480 Transcript_37870/m.68480 type:complete len:211 (-) Transcript_37870:236-868(-)